MKFMKWVVKKLKTKFEDSKPIHDCEERGCHISSPPTGSGVRKPDSDESK